MKYGFLSWHVIFSLLMLAACAQKKEKADDVTVAPPVTETPALDSLDVPRDTAKVIPPKPVMETPKTPEGYDPNKAKVCNPSFKLLKSPAPNHHVYYVTGFNPGEFKCWEIIEAHGQDACDRKPCEIYYVDAPDVKIGSAPPYVDKAVLAKKGVGYFTHDNHFFEIKGSKLWGRTDKGFLYYNTNNHLGG